MTDEVTSLSQAWIKMAWASSQTGTKTDSKQQK
jgi:hypothetical protein